MIAKLHSRIKLSPETERTSHLSFFEEHISDPVLLDIYSLCANVVCHHGEDTYERIWLLNKIDDDTYFAIHINSPIEKFPYVLEYYEDGNSWKLFSAKSLDKMLDYINRRLEFSYE